MLSEQKNSLALDNAKTRESLSLCTCGSAPCVVHDLHPATEILDSQSGLAKFNVTVNTGTTDSTSQNVSFKDQSPAYGYEVVSTPDPSFAVADTEDASLGNFFERPIKIYQDNWATTDGDFYNSINPWKLYFENPRVSNRISNFNLLRCKLHLKILINGNGFHYGRLIAAYKPLPDVDNFTVSRGFVTHDLIAASQRPHIYLDPTTSAGGEMCLPFFYFKNALSIPESEWSEMGELEFHPLQMLKHANGATDSVTISVFAWASEVSLSIPTVAEPDTLSPQSGEIILDSQADEYDKNNGPISKPATILSKVAGRLTDVPVIGMYARASEIAASGVASMANLFGYSRPASLVEVPSYKPTTMGNLANTNVPDSVQKLTIDFKQETTVDPRTTGLGTADEMSIASIACRESYLFQAPWAVSTAPETLLCSAQVTPYLWSEYVNGSNTEIHMPACCFAGLPFEQWRGSMKYRFQIVCSQYHKGRLKIVYDPATNAASEYNTNYTKIVDIAEEKDFTVEIGWGSTYPFLSEQAPGTAAVPWRADNTPVTSAPLQRINGYISVYVVNELTVPNSDIDNDININVFVSAGEDIQFFNPSARNVESLTWFLDPQVPPPRLDSQSGEVPQLTEPDPLEPVDLEALKAERAKLAKEKEDRRRRRRRCMLDTQSGEMDAAVTSSDKENTVDPSAPIQTETVEIMAPSIDPLDGSAVTCFGERITSFRQCLKRYCLHSVFGAETAGLRHLIRVSGIFPYYRGFAPNGINRATTSNLPYNYCKMTLMNYLTPAFAGWRGGVRHKIQRLEAYSAHQGNVPLHHAHMTVKREFVQQTYSLTDPQATFYDNNNYISHDNMEDFDMGWDGATVNSTMQNGAIEAELPYQANLRFWPGKKSDYTEDLFYMDTFKFQTLTDVDDTSGCIFTDWVAVADDFSLFFFTGCPIAYYAPTDPVPF